MRRTEQAMDGSRPVAGRGGPLCGGGVPAHGGGAPVDGQGALSRGGGAARWQERQRRQQEVAA
ncbi:hypothetical protein [Streptomyces longwoodensis]|uniref:hypothetical protein n=1 Tax=Streptomyces longwoodensis TaxID=68231 RepID=UPI0033FE20ED